jgi:hypothetical protein
VHEESKGINIINLPNKQKQVKHIAMTFKKQSQEDQVTSQIT